MLRHLLYQNPDISRSTAGLVLLDTKTASASATIELVGMNANYDLCLCVGTGLLPATDGVQMILRTGAAGSYSSGTNDYSYGLKATEGSGAVWSADALISDTTHTDIIMSDSTGGQRCGFNAGERGDWTVWIYNPSNTDANKYVSFIGHYGNTAGVPVFVNNGLGVRLATAAIDGIQLLYSSGNIASGTASLYGVAK